MLVIIPDLNLLIYAVDASFPQHGRARQWWEDTLNGEAPVGLCDVVSFGFLRLTTRRGIFAQPLSVATAVNLIEEWLAVPVVEALSLTDRSRAQALAWMHELGMAGNLSTDLQIAAIANQHRGTVCSNDADFSRIPGLRVQNPLLA